jgi:CRP-like cAMP-binding protein
MGAPMIETHLRKLRQRDEISAEEEAAIRASIAEVRTVAADRTVIRRGEELNNSLLLVEGWLARTKDLRSGQRQITELHVPGDFADLHSFTLKRLEHDVIALTKCKLAVVPHDNLRRMTERYPHLTRVYWFMTNLDASIQREWTLSVGRRSALSSMANLFCEMFVRLEVAELTSGDSYAFPLTQDELAACLGLTAVHVNRTLQELRRRELIEVAKGNVTILDRRGLESVAEFDPAYLYLERKPR